MAYFIEHNVFKLHLCCSRCQDFIPFLGSSSILCHVHSWEGGAFSYFCFQVIVNNVALTILVVVKGFGVFIECMWASQVVLVVKNLPTNAGDIKDGFDPWVGKIPWRRAWQPTPAFMPERSHGWRSLAVHGP